MSRRMIKIVVLTGLVWAWCGAAGGVELVIPSDVSVNLNRQIGKNYYRFPVESSEAGRIGAEFEGWTGESLDFDIAKRTTSDRFGGRETFYQELKENKLRETKGFQMRIEIYDKVFPFLIPGIGHIWKGYNARGFCFLWIFFIFVCVGVYWKGIVPPAIPSPTYGIFGGAPLFLAAVFLFYLAVLRGGYKKEGLEIVKPSFSLEGIRR